MKPYDKLNSFIRRVIKRVSEFIPGKTWMNMLLSQSHSVEDSTLSTKHDDQPPVKRLCTSNNTFINNRKYLDPNPLVNTTNIRSSYVHLPEISAVTCKPSTSMQNSKFTSESNSSFLGHGIGNRSYLKRKLNLVELSNINKTKTPALCFASSTRTLDTSGEPQIATIVSKRSFQSGKLFTINEFPTSTLSKLIEPRKNESQSDVKLNETTKNISSASFRWDTFINYGELSERQQFFAQKSPLNCSRALYGGRSAHSNLFKIVGNPSPLHRKAVIPISSSNSSTVKTTSSILLGHISSKNKEIKENKFIIKPRIDNHLKHKSGIKTVPLKEVTSEKIIVARLQKPEEKSHDISLNLFGKKISRKLRTKISKKMRGLKPNEHEMPAKGDLPDISLPMSVLPIIKLSNNKAEDHNFTFNQPLTLEEFGLQIIDETSKKNQLLTFKKTQNIITDLSQDHQSCSVASSFCDDFMKYSGKGLTTHNNNELKNLYKNDTVSKLCKFANNSKDILNNHHPLDNSYSILEFAKSANMVFENSSQVMESNFKKPQKTEKVSVELKKWPCETCLVPIKNETDTCTICLSQKSGFIKKVVAKCNIWTCDVCWMNNKSESTSCISCRTARPGFILENKPHSLTQLNFGFVSDDKAGQLSNQFKYGSTIIKTSASEKSDVCTTELKFGLTNNECNEFGIISAMNQSVNKPDEISYSYGTGKSSNQFKFNFGNKSDQHESRLNFGINVITNKHIGQFNLGSNADETEKSDQQSVATDNIKFKQSINKFLVTNDKSAKLEVLPNKSNLFELSDTKQLEKSSHQITFGSVKTNCINSLVDVHNNKDLLYSEKIVEDKKIKLKPIVDLKMPSTVLSIEVNAAQLVNGYLHSNEEYKFDLIKISQLFGFGSLAKQDPNLSNDLTTYKFGSATIENKLFVTPVMGTSFSNISPVFGASNSIFSCKPTTSTPATLSLFTITPKLSFGQLAPSTLGNTFTDDKNLSTYTSSILNPSVSTSKFSFGSMNSPKLNYFVKDFNKNPLPQTLNSLNSTTNIGFSFGTQSPSVFSVANAGGFKTLVKVNDQTKDTPNSIFNVKET